MNQPTDPTLDDLEALWGLPDATEPTPGPAPTTPPAAKRPAVDTGTVNLVDADVPIHTGRLQAQGDVLIRPTVRPMPWDAQEILDHHPVPVVRGGNGHDLVARLADGGTIRWAPVAGHPNIVALVEVTGAAVALLGQPGGSDPHQAVAFGAGRYELRRQTEVIAQYVSRPASD